MAWFAVFKWGESLWEELDEPNGGKRERDEEILKNEVELEKTVTKLPKS